MRFGAVKDSVSDEKMAKVGNVEYSVSYGQNYEGEVAENCHSGKSQNLDMKFLRRLEISRGLEMLNI